MQSIKDNMNIDDYHKDKMVISSTGLKEIKKSTRHFLWYLTHAQEQKSHFDFGNAFELAVMDAVNNTDLFSKEVAILETEKWVEAALKEKPELISPKLSKAYKDLKADFLSKNEGKYLIDDVGETESKEALDAMVNSCMNDEIIKRLLTGTEYQKSLFWTDKETGLKLKTRPDVCKVKKNVIVDIKTANEADPESFSRQAANLDYFIQACMQIDGCIQTGLMDNVDFYFWLAVEKKPPYNATIYEFQQEDIMYITDVYHDLLKAAKRSMELIKEAKDPYFTNLRGYGERSEHQSGIYPIEVPLFYLRNQRAYENN